MPKLSFTYLLQKNKDKIKPKKDEKKKKKKKEYRKEIESCQKKTIREYTPFPFSPIEVDPTHHKA